MELTPEEEARFRKRMAIQRQEIVSPLNCWGAGKEFGHEPTDYELAKHYVEVGAAKDFDQRHPDI